MKKMLLCLGLAVTVPAQASFYQEYCSSPDTTVTLANGHVDNFVKVTSRDWSAGYPPLETVITLQQPKLLATVSQVMSDKVQSSCDNSDDMYGFVSWETVTFKKLVISNADGSLFGEHVLGRSADGLTVVTEVLCKLSGDSETICDRPEAGFESE